MSGEVFQSSFEASEPNPELRYPRRGDTVFCASVTEDPIIGDVKKVGPDGTVFIKVGKFVRLKTMVENVQVIFRPRSKNRFT